MVNFEFLIENSSLEVLLAERLIWPGETGMPVSILANNQELTANRRLSAGLAKLNPKPCAVFRFGFMIGLRGT